MESSGVAEENGPYEEDQYLGTTPQKVIDVDCPMVIPYRGVTNVARSDPVIENFLSDVPSLIKQNETLGLIRDKEGTHFRPEEIKVREHAEYTLQRRTSSSSDLAYQDSFNRIVSSISSDSDLEKEVESEVDDKDYPCSNLLKILGLKVKIAGNIISRPAEDQAVTEPCSRVEDNNGKGDCGSIHDDMPSSGAQDEFTKILYEMLDSMGSMSMDFVLSAFKDIKFTGAADEITEHFHTMVENLKEIESSYSPKICEMDKNTYQNKNFKQSEVALNTEEEVMDTEHEESASVSKVNIRNTSNIPSVKGTQKKIAKSSMNPSCNPGTSLQDMKTHHLSNFEHILPEKAKTCGTFNQMRYQRLQNLKKIDKAVTAYSNKGLHTSPEEQTNQIKSMFSKREYCNDKVSLAKQSYEMVNKDIRKRNSKLPRFEADLKDKNYGHKQVLPGSNTTANKKGKKANKKRKVSKEETEDRAASPFPLSTHSSDVLYMPVNPNEPTYCLCNQVANGKMVGCDNFSDCPIEWFHFPCVQIKRAPKGKWYCPRCQEERNKK